MTEELAQMALFRGLSAADLQPIGARLHAKSFPANRLRKIKRLCQELDFLAPATDDEGQRPDNCEYPWETGASSGPARVIVPAEHEFPVLSLLQSTEAVELLKCVKSILPALAE